MTLSTKLPAILRPLTAPVQVESDLVLLALDRLVQEDDGFIEESLRARAENARFVSVAVCVALIYF